MTTAIVIAIDGPAASGKSSTARAVADRLGFVHVDSGALYRAATWIALESGSSTGAEIAAQAEAAGLELARDGVALEMRRKGHDLTAQIRSGAVTARVSEVAAWPEVRGWVNRILREAVAGWGGAVMDGRDIGTDVFPDAALKVFLTASPEARARRRLLQLGTEPDPATLAAETDRLAERDRLDAGRAVAPLRQATDALLLDTTALGFADQVDQIVAWAESRGLSRR